MLARPLIGTDHAHTLRSVGGWILRAAGAANEGWHKARLSAPDFSASLGGNDGDLDKHLRIGELGLNAGAAGKVLTLGPRVPSFIHGIAQTDLRHPHFRLVGAAKLQETIDFLEDLLGLPLGVLL